MITFGTTFQPNIEQSAAQLLQFIMCNFDKLYRLFLEAVGDLYLIWEGDKSIIGGLMHVFRYVASGGQRHRRPVSPRRGNFKF